ncbi:MAG: family 10 glycosylhydrolase [Chitinophagaceae bacterium]|nr:family 10 glycosylhydrolase [Chitinophagaceae bacterium]
MLAPSLQIRFAANLIISLFLLLLVGACSKKGSGGNGPTNPGTPVIPPATPVWDPNALRGAWVTNVASTALDSRENIKLTVQNCKKAGINNIFIVTYNNGRTIYPSTVMNNLIGKPIMERFAGRDPLKEMIEEAKLEGIKVHAWFEYGFSSSYSANGGDIITAKPNWAGKDVDGKLLVKNGFDWLNAFDPEVQDFMISLFKEVVTKYDIDGVQGDDRLPALPSTGGYDTYTKNLFKTENGFDPPANYRDAFWIDWRTKKLNAFMKRLRNEIKATKSTVQVTMSPSPYPWGKDEYLQDWPTWVDSGWVDAILPQCYRYDIAAYNATISQQKGYYKNTAVPFYPGVLLKVGTYVTSVSLLNQMIQTNRNNGFKGECYFFYEGVKDQMNWFQLQYPYIK